VIPNIYAVQTVDSGKKATTLNRSLPAERTDPLHVYIQVNTSGEEQKSGISCLSEGTANTSSSLFELAKLIVQDCPRLHLMGLMTIGSFKASTASDDENPDFKALEDTRILLERLLNSDETLPKSWGENGRLDLSMGMSADFELAIRMGSGSVRVGTGIFGSRPQK